MVPIPLCGAEFPLAAGAAALGGLMLVVSSHAQATRLGQVPSAFAGHAIVPQFKTFWLEPSGHVTLQGGVSP
jgi:hypothetical protein